jgi:hypothetical protein
MFVCLTDSSVHVRLLDGFFRLGTNFALNSGPACWFQWVSESSGRLVAVKNKGGSELPTA